MPLIHSKAGQWTGEWGRGGAIQGFGAEDGGGFGVEPFDFDVAGGIENIPAQQIDFDKEAYYQSIVAPAEAARRDATTEAVASGRALSAHTGRAPGDMESEILAGSIRQAGATSAHAAGEAEKAGLEVEKIEQADLTRRTQASIAQGQLKEGAWAVMANIKARYAEMKANHAHASAMLTRQLGAQKAEAEMNRRSAYDIEMFKINSGMEMLKYKEDSANLRVAAGLAMGEAESVRMQAYRMEYLDRMSKIQSMDSVRKLLDQFGRASQFYNQPQKTPEMMGGSGISGTDYNQGTDWWDIEPGSEPYDPWQNLTPP
jgi:hypothetical protein